MTDRRIAPPLLTNITPPLASTFTMPASTYVTAVHTHKQRKKLEKYVVTTFQNVGFSLIVNISEQNASFGNVLTDLDITRTQQRVRQVPAGAAVSIQ